MVGSDLESENGYASADLHEMTGAFPANGTLEVLVRAGGAARWHNGLPSGPQPFTASRPTARKACGPCRMPA